MDVFKDNKGAWSPKNPPSMRSVLRAVFGAVVAVLLIVAAFTSYYTVDTEEQAVVLRFGKYIETASPGLHFKIPFGVDQAIAVPVEKVRKEEFGYETLSAGVRTQYKNRTSEVQDTALMLTGDLNIADVEWVVQYKIKDARDWVFNVRNQVAAIRDLSESVMRMVVGDHTITEVVTKRERIKPLVKKALQEAVDSYGLGVHIESVEIQNSLPPGPVQESFREVNSAEQERSQLENEAEREYNKVIPKARGEAEQVLEQAKGYAVERVNRAKGDVARFIELLAAYRESKDVTRRRLYLETVEKVLPKVRRIVVASDEGVLKLLPIDTTPGGGR